MQQIKFRAWIKDAPQLTREEGMFYQEDQYLSSFIRRIYDQYGVTHPSYLPFQLEERLMLSTNKLDMNGKEIYDKDILRHLPSNDLYEVQRCVGGFNLQVWKELKNGGAMKDSIYSFCAIGKDFCEVIGNTYDNPELL